MLHVKIGDTGQFTMNDAASNETQAAIVVNVNQADDTVDLIAWNASGISTFRRRADVTIKAGTPGAFLST